jgi:hypothetical protein
MVSAVLYYTYGLVMLVALGCFVQAFRRRRDTPVHRRWGVTGVVLTLTGIVVVLALTYGLGWRVEQRLPEVVDVHRKLALASTALVLLVAFTGMRRIKIHKRLYVLFLPLYVATVATALIGYRP